MLNFMRRQSQNLRWVWVGLIIFLTVPLLTYLIPSLGDYAGTVQLSGDVAHVGSESISARQFQQTYSNYRQQMQAQITDEVAKALNLDRQILNSMIQDRIVKAEAHRLGLSVSDQELEQEIMRNPAFRDAQNNFIGEQEYRLRMRSANFSIEEYEGSLRDAMLREKLRTLVTASVAVGDKEVEEEYRRRNERAILDYLVIEPLRLESQVTASEQEIKDHYEKNKTIYNMPERRQAKYIFFSIDKLSQGEKPTDAEVQDYYSQHRNDFLTAKTVKAQQIFFKVDAKTTPQEFEKIQEKARGVLERAKAGDDFAALARQYSEDRIQAPRGGDMGGVQPGETPEEFEKALNALSPGAISDLVRDQNGLHIIKVNDKQEERTRSLEEVKKDIVPTLAKEKAGKKASELAQRAAVETIKNKDLDAVAKNVGGEVRQTALLERGSPIKDIADKDKDLGVAPDFQTQLFNLKEKGDIGPSVPTPGGYAVLMLVDKQEPHPSSFEEAKEQVTQDVKIQKAKELAVQKGNQVQEQIKAGKDLRTVAKAVGVDIKTSEPITRGASLPEFGSLIDVEKEVFSLPPGKTGTPANSAGRTMAFVVKERKPIDPEEMKKSMDKIRGELLNRKREEYFQAYQMEARKRMEEAKQITINEALFAQTSGI